MIYTYIDRSDINVSNGLINTYRFTNLDSRSYRFYENYKSYKIVVGKYGISGIKLPVYTLSDTYKIKNDLLTVRYKDSFLSNVPDNKVVMSITDSYNIEKSKQIRLRLSSKYRIQVSLFNNTLSLSSKYRISKVKKDTINIFESYRIAKSSILTYDIESRYDIYKSPISSRYIETLSNNISIYKVPKDDFYTGSLNTQTISMAILNGSNIPLSLVSVVLDNENYVTVDSTTRVRVNNGDLEISVVTDRTQPVTFFVGVTND